MKKHAPPIAMIEVVDCKTACIVENIKIYRETLNTIADNLLINIDDLLDKIKHQCIEIIIDDVINIIKIENLDNKYLILRGINRTDSLSYATHTGRELTMMLDGKKPMASFCRYANDKFDESKTQPFSVYVNLNYLYKMKFYLKIDENNIIYTLFSTKENQWRMSVYKKLKKSSRDTQWNNQKDAIEGLLLGYSLEQCVEYQSIFKSSSNGV